MLQVLQSLDAFPKAHDDYRVKTTTGALVSIISIFIMIILFFSELRYYMKTEVVEHLYVNTTRSNSLTIDFDLSFPNIACNLLSIDAVDDRGIPHTDAVHELYKHRLSKAGEKIGTAEQHFLGDSVKTEKELEELAILAANKAEVVKQQIGSCGNCYGAGAPGACCNTCEDVKRAYERSGWRFKPQGIIQCSSEVYMQSLKEQFAEDGGCQVYGRLELSKSSGHFHIVPHKKIHQNQAPVDTNILNLMDLISFAFDQFNVSHTINSLSFGDQYPGFKSPLDGQTRAVLDTHGMYQYYVKVVPTKYKGLKMETAMSSNQYSVTEHLSHLAPGSGRGLPGVYFYYEVSPIQASIEEKRGSNFLRFLTSACAIIGGAYSVMGLVDLFLGFVFTYIYKESL